MRVLLRILQKTRVNSAGKTVKDYSLVFEISQRTQDLQILNLIASYFKVGNIYTDTSLKNQTCLIQNLFYSKTSFE